MVVRCVCDRVVSVAPKVLQVTPDITTTVTANTLVTVGFDVPVAVRGGVVFIGRTMSRCWDGR